MSLNNSKALLTAVGTAKIFTGRMHPCASRCVHARKENRIRKHVRASLRVRIAYSAFAVI